MADAPNKIVITAAERELTESLVATLGNKSATMRELYTQEGWSRGRIAAALSLVYGKDVRFQFVYNVTKSLTQGPSV